VSVTSTIWPGTSVCAPTTPGALTLSSPQRVDLRVYRGDTGRFRVQVALPGGDDIDLTLAQWDCDIRSSVDSTTVIASLTVMMVNATTVEVVIDAATSASLPGNCVWDLEMTLGGDVTTLLTGEILVTKDVSRT